jgi:hypothetical protein
MPAQNFSKLLPWGGVMNANPKKILCQYIVNDPQDSGPNLLTETLVISQLITFSSVFSAGKVATGSKGAAARDGCRPCISRHVFQQAPANYHSIQWLKPFQQ